MQASFEDLLLEQVRVSQHVESIMKTQRQLINAVAPQLNAVNASEFMCG